MPSIVQMRALTPPLPRSLSSCSNRLTLQGRPGKLEDSTYHDFFVQFVFNRGKTEDTECFCGRKKTFIEASLKSRNQEIKKTWKWNSPCVSNHSIIFQENIVGGDYAVVNEFPWVALLNLSSSENGATARCGGSLISDRFLMLMKKLNLLN